jgi:hypothetical protein
MAAFAPSESQPEATDLSLPATPDAPSSDGFGGDRNATIDELVPIAALEALGVRFASLESRATPRWGIPAQFVAATIASVIAIAVLYVGLGVVMDRAQLGHGGSVVSAERRLPAQAGAPRERTSPVPRRARTRNRPLRPAGSIRRPRPWSGVGGSWRRSPNRHHVSHAL